MVDPWGGFNDSLNNLNNTFVRARGEDRQATLDAQNAAAARQQLAMGDIQLQQAQQSQQARQDAIAAGKNAQPSRTMLYDQQGPVQPVANPQLDERAALAQKLASLKGQLAAGPTQPLPGMPGNAQDQADALQGQVDAIPADAQVPGAPLPQVSIPAPVTDQDRQAAMAQSYMQSGFPQHAMEIIQQGGAVTDMLAKMKAKATEFGDVQSAANFEAKATHIEQLGDMMDKLRKADPSGALVKQYVSTHPQDFPGLDPSKIGMGANGMVSWPIDQNGVQGIGYLDTDGKIKFQAANEHRNQTWSEPYTAMVGGKKVLLQKSSTGETKQVSADQSTTVQNIIQAGKDSRGVSAGGLSDQAVEDAAKMYNINGVLPSGRNKEANAAIQNRAAELRKASGQSAAGVIANAGDLKALNQSISQQEKQVGSMGSFVKNIDKQVNRFEQISKDLGSADTRLLNVPLRALRGRVAGSPLQAKVDMYLAEISSETGKLASGATGSVAELSQGAREKWEKIHDPNLSMADLLDVLKETRHAGAMRMDSVNEQLAATRQKRAAVGAGTSPYPQITQYIKSNIGKYPESQLISAIKAANPTITPQEIHAAYVAATGGR